MQFSGRSRLLRLLVTIGLSINIGIALSYVGLWVMTARQGQFWRADFTSYFTGWSIVKNGDSRQLYDLNLQTRYQREILNEDGILNYSFADSLLPFTYPPHVALFFSPLAQLPLPSAFLVWTIAECVLLIWLLRMLYESTKLWQPVERALIFTLLLGFPPLLYNFMQGAFSLFILLCIWQFAQSLKNNRSPKSGVWLAIAFIKPQDIIFPGFILVGARRWKGIKTAALAGISIFVITSLVMGWRIWLSFLQRLSSMNNLFGQMGMQPRYMDNFKEILTSLIGSGRGELINAFSDLAFAVCILITIWIWHAKWSFQNGTYELFMSYTLLLGIFFNVYLFPQDSLLFFLPIIFFYQYLRIRGLPKLALSSFILACPLIFLLSDLVIGNKLGFRLSALVMAGLLVWMTPALWNERQHRPIPLLNEIGN